MGRVAADTLLFRVPSLTPARAGVERIGCSVGRKQDMAGFQCRRGYHSSSGR